LTVVWAIVVFPANNRVGLLKKKKKVNRRKGKRAKGIKLESGGIKNFIHKAECSISKQFKLS